ncbi:Na+:solute symporter, partial [candidate division KSB1 bacterium]|nr:Na+:solute symporter [candidate division KSB1 bacterium]
MLMKPRKVLFLLLLFIMTLPMHSCQKKSEVIDENISNKAVKELRHTLHKRDGWVKVHAAEYLLALSYPAGVYEKFTAELRDNDTTPQYRIGVWRTLARSSFNKEERQKWINKIWDVYLDKDASDRMHAAETLSKLDENLLSREPQIARQFLGSNNTRLAAFVRWGMAVNSDDQLNINELVASLNTDDLNTRKITAYGIRLNVGLTPKQWQILYQAASNEPDSSSAAVYLVGAAYTRMPEEMHSTEVEQKLHKRMRSFLFTDTKENRYHACEALADRGTVADLPSLYKLFNGESELEDDALPPEFLADQNADVRSAAANAILRIYRRIPAKMSSIDWLVIAIYGIGMLAIGWYYARRTKNSEDYNLGGRIMNPTLVGLSLFASILSTLSYLAYPGEMIKNGPMYFTNLLVFPLVFLIVGWWFIPTIMRMKVTSANEILEIKLGKNIRLLGTFFFLSLRLLWMATIIYATVDNVLLPIFGIDASYLPLVCAVMGVVTLIYTSMGGLRAVVLTDVIQTVILIGGVVLTIILVSIHFGSITTWFPTKWAAHWSDVKIGFDMKTRVTMFNAMLMVFGWYICTAGSDQIAIQRYLATRDAKSARRSFGVSVLTNFSVQVLLGIVGLALLAYFTNIPHLLPDGNTLLSVA